MIYTENQEETILKPSNTEFRIDAVLMESDYLIEPFSQYRSYPEYKFSVQPLMFQDHQMVMELVERAIVTIEIEMGPYSTKVAKSAVEGKYGMIEFSQLFAPRVSGDDIEPYQLHQRQCSIKGHLREGPDGKIFAQADYVDVKPLEVPVGTAESFVDEDDW